MLLVVTPDSVFGVLTSAQALIIALFGGVATLVGAADRRCDPGAVQRELQAQLGNTVPGIQGVVYGMAIVLVLLLAPEGIYWRVRDRLVRRRASEPHRPRLPRRRRCRSRCGPQAMADASPILTVEGLSKSFGGLRAVEDVCFEVPRGSVLGIIGPNGAGKTTLFNL